MISNYKMKERLTSSVRNFTLFLTLLTVALMNVNCSAADNVDEAAQYVSLQKERAELLRQGSVYTADTIQFNIHSRLDLKRIRVINDYFNLDSIAAGCTTTWQRTLAVAKFVAAHVPHGNQTVQPERRNAIALWEYLRDVEPAINCRLHSIMMFEMLSSLGISATFVTCLPKDSNDEDCHVVNQVWLPELGKWAMIDADFGGNYPSDEKGTPLSLAEMRERYIAGADIYYHAGFGDGTKQIGFYHAYMAKNCYWFACWETLGFDQEPENPNSSRHILLTPEGFMPFLNADVVTHDAKQFWAKPCTEE